MAEEELLGADLLVEEGRGAEEGARRGEKEWLAGAAIQICQRDAILNNCSLRMTMGAQKSCGQLRELFQLTNFGKFLDA